jgi:hypothetical protein
LPLLDDGIAAIVAGITRNVNALRCFGRNGVFDFELQLAEGFGLKRDLDPCRPTGSAGKRVCSSTVARSGKAIGLAVEI